MATLLTSIVVAYLFGCACMCLLVEAYDRDRIHRSRRHGVHARPMRISEKAYVVFAWPYLMIIM